MDTETEQARGRKEGRVSLSISSKTVAAIKKDHVAIDDEMDCDMDVVLRLYDGNDTQTSFDR